MKVVILHLSDIHFKGSKEQNPVLSRTEQIAAAVASIASTTASCCFVVTTGDIAFSGKQVEYALAEGFFSELSDRIRDRLPPQCGLHFVMIPGNHDCDFSQSQKAREVLLRDLTTSDLDESVLSQCAGIQDNYEDFATQWRTESIERNTLSRTYTQEIYDLPQGTVEVRLLNSAWMSTVEEQQGNLLFPVELLQSDKDVSPAADLVVTMLHHPYDWFEVTNARALRNEIEATSDVILTGHEHEGDFYTKDRVTGERTEYLEGLVLQDSANPQMSLFNVLVVDLDEQAQEVHTFSWGESGHYEPEGTPACIPFQRNRYRLRDVYRLGESFEEFLTDPGAKFTHPQKERIVLDDLFVYPDLLQLHLSGEEPLFMRLVRDQVSTFVLNHRHVLLVGPDECGKTTLSKVLFRDLRKSGFVPIHVSGSEFKGCTEASVSSTIERSFEKAYASPDINVFRQLEPAKKAIIVDDFHRSGFNARGRDRIIRALENLFDVVVLFGNEQIRFEDLITQEGEDRAIWHFTQCQILPFGHLRRADLIKKWYFLGRRLTHEEGELIRRTVQAEKLVSLLLGQDFIPGYPIFILIMLQQMEVRTQLDTAPTSGSYGFLYESLLTIALAHSSRLEIDLDTQYNYLSEFAYLLFKSRVYSISTDEAFDWHQRYCDEYRLRLSFEKIISDFCAASVLCEHDNTVSFRYPYMYYYFVGRYFRDHIGEKEIRDHISSMSEQLYFEEFANILLFLSYLSKDPFILSSILEASRSLFSSYPECDLVEHTEFLGDFMTSVPELVLDSSLPEDRRRELLACQDELEAAWADQEECETATIELEPVDKDRYLQESQQMQVAFKTIQILGQVLRNFPGSLKGAQKIELIKECYSLGLRVLKFVFDSVEADQEGLIQFLASLLRSWKHQLSDEQLTEQVKSLVFSVIEVLAFVVVRHVSDSVGFEKLSMTFDDLLGEGDNISYRFIDLSIRLDYFRSFPEKQVLQLAKNTRRNLFATQLLRRLIWYHFYIYQVSYRIRQSICAKLGIKLLPATISDKRVKQLKG